MAGAQTVGHGYLNDWDHKGKIFNMAATHFFLFLFFNLFTLGDISGF
jgi:hypothetical protein